MGSSFGKSIGPRSGYRPDASTNKEIDYRDPLYAERAKRELYTLFLDGKIAHISNLEELQAKLDKMQKEVSARLENRPESTKQPMPESVVPKS